jgi:hypothetical protein
MITAFIQNILPEENPQAQVTTEYLGGITFDISYDNVSKETIARIDEALALSISYLPRLPAQS